jgi:hypothetical protein
MQQTFRANDIDVGYHPSGYKIDKTAAPMDRYTKWEIGSDDVWRNSVPVCFDSMPADGWMKYKN